MKFPLVSFKCLGWLLGAALVLASPLRAQDSDAPLNQPQLDQLLGPIALYPDALVALILPASTVPSDVVLAARYLANGGDPEQIDNQVWNESVKALAHYPMLIKWMDDNLQWTQQLGSAFLNQPDAVMDSVQRLRARARATGALTSTAQQKLVLDGDDIEIVPAQPDVIYVPYYDPDVVYVSPQPGYYPEPYLTFGLGLPIGFWLSYDFNWRTHALLVGNRRHNWSTERDWNRHPGPGGYPSNGNWHQWKPPATRPPFARPENRRPGGNYARPKPMPGAPAYPRHDQPPERPRPAVPGHDGDRDHAIRPANNPPPQPVVRENHDPRPAPPTLNPRPENTPPGVNPPRPNIPDRPGPPMTTRPDNSHVPLPAHQVPTRPEPRPEARPANPPPPPPRDDSREKDPEPR